MAREQVRSFFEAVECDRELQEKLRRVAMENERKALNEVVEIAESAGFRFGVLELSAARKRQLQYYPGFDGEPKEATKECCHYKQGCMPGFCSLED